MRKALYDMLTGYMESEEPEKKKKFTTQYYQQQYSEDAKQLRSKNFDLEKQNKQLQDTLEATNEQVQKQRTAHEMDILALHATYKQSIASLEQEMQRQVEQVTKQLAETELQLVHYKSLAMGYQVVSMSQVEWTTSQLCKEFVDLRDNAIYNVTMELCDIRGEETPVRVAVTLYSIALDGVWLALFTEMQHVSKEAKSIIAKDALSNQNTIKLMQDYIEKHVCALAPNHSIQGLQELSSKAVQFALQMEVVVPKCQYIVPLKNEIVNAQLHDVIHGNATMPIKWYIAPGIKTVTGSILCKAQVETQ